MSAKDYNGVKIKPDHEATGLPFGEPVWLLRRYDDKLYGVWTSRHEAIGAATTMTTNKEEWLTPIRVLSGTVRLEDIVVIDG